MLGIQETKMTRLDLFLFRALWGNYQFYVASNASQGRPGSLLTVWDPSTFKKTKVWSMESVLVVEWEIIAKGIRFFLVNIYAPQDRRKKKWSGIFLSSFMSSNVGEFLLFGDFNVVRYPNERSGSVFCQIEDDDFNNFIANSDLTDVKMRGRRFTRVDSLCSKMEKLDRFW